MPFGSPPTLNRNSSRTAIRRDDSFKRHRAVRLRVAMNVRCPRCQTILPALPTQPQLVCPACGHADANPFYAPPPVAPTAYPPPGATAPYGMPGRLIGLKTPEAENAEKTALTFGLISLIGGVIFFLPLYLGIVAIIYGNKAKRLGGDATAGLVLGWISLSLGLLAILVIAFFVIVFWAAYMGAVG